MITTLNKIKEHSPCIDGWEKLLKSLNKTKADDEPITIRYILESNGLNDAIWALRAVDNHDREIRLFAVWCARQVQYLMTDQGSINALDVAERYANNKATRTELKAAWCAAQGEEQGAAQGAAHDAAWEAAWYAAQDAAKDAVWGKVGNSAQDAARNAARDAQSRELIRICTESSDV